MGRGEWVGDEMPVAIEEEELGFGVAFDAEVAGVGLGVVGRA